MSSLKINHDPAFLQSLIKKETFKKNPFILFDVGARDGYEKHWKFFGDQIKIIGFEPDEKECKRLNKLKSPLESIYFPVALHEDERVRKFHLMKKRLASTFSDPSMSFLSRFPDEVNFIIEKTVNIKTISLDKFSSKEKIKYIDFVKLDAEGSEFEILNGSKKYLKSSILGISLEVQFNHLFKNKALFSEIDLFLRKFGFQLFDVGLIHLKRKSLSFMSKLQDYGQLAAGHALYLRDPIDDLKQRKTKFWNREKILKLACIMELYNLSDCALELLSIIRDKKNRNETNMKNKHLLAPDDINVPALNKIKQKVNKYFALLLDQTI